ncbi:MAG: methyl-accepting chemotaxis protein [Lachnospiraceae bacterium]|nr:methyl-accepting chemotaxis protein [Lachnospiraceae bacterium]
MEQSKEKKNAKSFLRLDSVKTKLIAIMLTVATVPLAVAIIISSISSTNKAKLDAQNSLASKASFLQAELHSTILNTQSALKTLAASPSTIEFLKNGGANASEVKNHMLNTNKCFDDENTIVLSNKAGMMVLRSDDAKFVDISDRNYFQSAMSGKPYVSEIVVSPATNSRNLCVAVPVYDTDGKTVIGCLHRSYALNNFHTLLANNVAEGFLIDNQGTLAAHSQYEIAADAEPVSYAQSPYMTSGKDSDTYISTASGTKAYVSYIKEPLSGYTMCVAQNYKEVISQARQSAMMIILVGAVLLVIVLIISIVLANGFTKPILAVDATLSALATGRFNRVEVYTERKDEFGDMVRNSNSVIEKLEAIVGHIKTSSNVVSESSEELSVMANQISATTETVAEAVQEIAAGASDQALSVQRSAENAGRITDAIVNVQNSASDLNTLASQMKEASETSSESLASFQETSHTMATKIEEISEKIAATQSAVAEINQRVEGITGIAAQTNLLSLNASIEAARAGDAGRGFSVVADEIRTLADDSKNLANEIHNVMTTLLTQSEEAVNAATEIIEDNKAQQASLAETLNSVQGMIENIEKTVSGVAAITEETTTCVDSNKEVSDAMSSLSAISEENAASTETTGASVEELSATVTTLAGSANNLKDVAEKLNEEIAFFQ